MMSCAPDSTDCARRGNGSPSGPRASARKLQRSPVGRSSAKAPVWSLQSRGAWRRDGGFGVRPCGSRVTLAKAGAASSARAAASAKGARIPLGSPSTVHLATKSALAAGSSRPSARALRGRWRSHLSAEKLVLESEPSLRGGQLQDVHLLERAVLLPVVGVDDRDGPLAP